MNVGAQANIKDMHVMFAQKTSRRKNLPANTILSRWKAEKLVQVETIVASTSSKR
jgi:hypothetical protein